MESFVQMKMQVEQLKAYNGMKLTTGARTARTGGRMPRAYIRDK
jgi:hypothetical protein